MKKPEHIKAIVRGKPIYVIDRDSAVECPLCGVLAVVPLPPEQLAVQPDDTTHVCHPGFDGCNHGFTVREELGYGSGSDS